MSELEFDPIALAAEMVDFLAVRRDGESLVADVPTWFGDYAFGGWVVAQAVAAAQAHVGAGDGRRMHALHAHFLRPVAGGQPIAYRVAPVREGRTVATYRLEGAQDGRPVFTMTGSFTADTDGYQYDLGVASDVPGPTDLPADVPVEPGPGPWVAARLGPTPARADGTRASTHRAWVRIDAPLPDDPAVHTALIAFVTDWTGTGGRPLHLEGDIEGMVSLDHAAWFHRPVRADEWLYVDVHSLVNAGGRGLLRGTIHDADGRVAASMAQEMLLRPVTPV